MQGLYALRRTIERAAGPSVTSLNDGKRVRLLPQYPQIIWGFAKGSILRTVQLQYVG
jgi:hypothetical protein